MRYHSRIDSRFTFLLPKVPFAFIVFLPFLAFLNALGWALSRLHAASSFLCLTIAFSTGDLRKAARA